jgi:hypothetical protein
MKNGEAEARPAIPVNSQAGAEARPANNIQHPIIGKTARMTMRMRMNEKHPAADELISAGKIPAIASMSLQ